MPVIFHPRHPPLKRSWLRSRSAVLGHVLGCLEDFACGKNSSCLPASIRADRTRARLGDVLRFRPRQTVAFRRAPASIIRTPFDQDHDALSQISNHSIANKCGRFAFVMNSKGDRGHGWEIYKDGDEKGIRPRVNIFSGRRQITHSRYLYTSREYIRLLLHLILFYPLFIPTNILTTPRVVPFFQP